MNLQGNIPAAGPSGREMWLEQRRKYFLRRIMADFLQLSELYSAIYVEYRKTGEKGTPGGRADLLGPGSLEFRRHLFDEISRMLGTENSKGLLWRLKDTCHQVWPENRQETTAYGTIVDWLIGSLFHEVMKLKENIYLLNNYSPSSPRLGRQVEGPTAASMHDALLQAIDAQGVFERIALDVEEELEGIGILLGRANFLLRLMLPEMADNDLVVRLLTEKEQVIDELWGESLESIFDDMFFGDPAGGFCAAGRSYLNGQWFNRAKAMYARALSIDAGYREALVKLVQLEAITSESDCSFGDETV